jgi:hypothetical protein
MNQNPQDSYRAMTPQPPSELERLAAQGNAQHDALVRGNSSEAARQAMYNLRVGLGGYRRPPLLQACAIVMYAAIAAAIAFIALNATDVVDSDVGVTGGIVAGVLAFILVFVRVFVPPYASQGQLDAEGRWLGSLPFRLSGYFEALQSKPEIYSNIRVTVYWAPGSIAPDPNTLIGVARGADPKADGLEIEQGRASWISGQIDGSTGIMINRVPVRRNHRIAKYVHALVDQTLMPLHRNGPIASVTLHRM